MFLFVLLCLVSNHSYSCFVYTVGLVDGTVNLVDGGDYVAVQMWVAVSKAMSWSCDMMCKLFDTVGATADERWPFCRNFSSPGDLRDEFIR